MNPGTINSNNLFEQLDETTDELISLLSPLNEEQLNKIPFEGSWTAAQLATHITMSIAAMAKSINEQGETGRKPDEKVAWLENAFLDLSSKLEVRDFIRPEERTYTKDEVMTTLQTAITDFRQNASNNKLNDVITHFIFKDISKYEIVVFIIVHTQRHVQQLKGIINSI